MTAGRGSTCAIALAAAVLLAAGAGRAAPAGPALPLGIRPVAGDGGVPAAEPKPAVATVASPQAIPVEHVFRSADELDGPLRRADAAAQPDPAVAEVERRLASAAEDVGRLRAELAEERLQDASAREIDRLRQGVAREDALLAEGQGVLEQRSDLLAGTRRDLEERLAAWRLTGEAAVRDGAPPEVLRRVEQVEATVRSAEAALRAEQGRVLGLQGRVSDLRLELGRIAASVEAAAATLQRQLFEVESAPLWRGLSGPDRAGALGAQLRQAVREGRRDVAAFLADEQGRVWLHLLLVALLGLGLVALRRPVIALEAKDAALRGAARVLARPWSAALLLSLPAAAWIYPPLPPVLRDLFFLIFLAPLLRLLPGLLPDVFRRPLLALAVLVALDRLSAMAPPRTLLARLAMLLVTAGALASLVRGLRPGGWVRAVRGGAWAAAARAAALASVPLLAVSAVSNVVGNATLAERLTHATLASAALAAALVGAQAALEGALAAVLHLPALARRPLVARHRALLQRRSVAVLRLLLVALWASRTAVELGIAGAAATAAAAVLGLRLRVGGLDVSLGNVVAFAVTLVLAWWLSRAVRFLLDEGVFAEVDLPRGVPTAVSTTVQYVLVLLGFSWAVLASGMEMSRFSFVIGALGVGVGFGLQNVVNNLVSGLILLYERPVQVRDVIEVGAVAGEVTRIGVRSSTVRTFSGAEVIVPNATLISAEVTNWTLSDRKRRIELAVGVAYGTPPQQVIDLLLAAVRDRPGVLGDPAPFALFLRFGESALEFTLRFWTADFDRWQLLASEVMIAVHESLDRAGIVVPFPQRDLHVRSVAPAAAAALTAAAARGADADDDLPRLGPRDQRSGT